MDKHDLGLIEFAVDDIFNRCVAGALFEAVGKVVGAELGDVSQFLQRDVFADVAADISYGFVDRGPVREPQPGWGLSEE